MSNITWGAEIKTPNGRPYGLDGDELCFPCWGEDNWYCAESSAVDCVHGWANVTKIRLPANHRFYHKLKEYDVIDVEDWAIEAAKNDVDCDWSIELLKTARYSSSTSVKAVLGLARMIQNHEQHRKPVDPDVIAVREILSAWYRNDTDPTVLIELHSEDFQAALTAYKAAKS